MKLLLRSTEQSTTGTILLTVSSGKMVTVLNGVAGYLLPSGMESCPLGHSCMILPCTVKTFFVNFSSPSVRAICNFTKRTNMLSVLNGEQAAMQAPVFAQKLMRTTKETLQEVMKGLPM